MLLDAWSGPIVCFALGVVWPWVSARGGDAASTARWLAFFLCALVLVGPIALLPAWLWLRYEFMVSVLALLGAGDARGAAVVLARYLEPALAPLDAAAARLKLADADAMCDGLERLVTRALAPPADAADAANAADAYNADTPPAGAATAAEDDDARASDGENH
jgi:hypothetical protein